MSGSGNLLLKAMKSSRPGMPSCRKFGWQDRIPFNSECRPPIRRRCGQARLFGRPAVADVTHVGPARKIHRGHGQALVGRDAPLLRTVRIMHDVPSRLRDESLVQEDGSGSREATLPHHHVLEQACLPKLASPVSCAQDWRRFYHRKRYQGKPILLV